MTGFALPRLWGYCSTHEQTKEAVAACQDALTWKSRKVIAITSFASSN